MSSNAESRSDESDALRAILATRHADIRRLVHSTFPSPFHVRESDDLVFAIRYNPKDETPCLYFTFDDDLSNLTIHQLNKCGPAHDLRSGTLLLQKVDELVREIPECKTIELDDAAYVFRCGWGINLAKFEILKTGESWYNQRGYKQRSYEKDTEENRKIITMSHENAASLLLQKSELSKPKFVEYKQIVDEKLPGLKGLPLNEYIQKLYQQIKSYPEEDKCSDAQNKDAEMVTFIIRAFNNLIKYNGTLGALQKVVRTSSAGGARKIRNRKRRTIKPRKIRKRRTIKTKTI